MTDLGKWEEMEEKHPPEKQDGFSEEELDCFQKFVKDCGFDGFIAINGVNDDNKASN